MTDREKLTDIVHKANIHLRARLNHGGVLYIVNNLIENGVTIQKQGEWVHDPLSSYGVHVWFCSQCNGEVIRQTDYCPHCGADMRGAEHETD